MSAPQHESWIFLFDADCGFCQRCVEVAKKVRPDITYIPNYEVDLEEYGLTQSDIDNASWYIRADKQVKLGGSAGIAALMAGSSLLPWRIAGIILQAPVIRTVIRPVYRLIADNRGRMPGSDGTCGLQR